MSDSAASDIERAESLSRKALAASPRNAFAHYALAQVLRVRQRWEEALVEYQAALALDRTLVNALHALGQCKLLSGLIDETIPLNEEAIRRSPRDPNINNWYGQIGFVHLLQSRTSQAISWLERARNGNPAHPRPHIWLASAYALEGRAERATAELAEARRLAPAGLYSSISRLRVYLPSLAPAVAALYESVYFAGLRKAGMPEE